MYSQVQAHELIDQFCLVRLVNTRSYTLNAGELLLRAVEDEKPSAALQFKSGTRNVRTMSDAERLNTPRERREWWLLRQMDEREMKDKRIASFLIGENQERDQTHPKGPEASRRLQTQTAEFDIDMSGRENNPYCRPSTPSPLPPCSRHSTPRWADSARIWCSFWVTGAQRLTPALVWVREYSYVILEFCENGSLHNISKHKRRCGGRQSILAPEVIEQRSVGCAQRRDQKSRRIIGATISRRGSRERSCKVVLEKTPAEEDHTGSSAEEDDTASDASHILARVVLTCRSRTPTLSPKSSQACRATLHWRRVRARGGAEWGRGWRLRCWVDDADSKSSQVLTIHNWFGRETSSDYPLPSPPRPSPSPLMGPNPSPSVRGALLPVRKSLLIHLLRPRDRAPLLQLPLLVAFEDVHYAASPPPWPIESLSVSPHETDTCVGHAAPGNDPAPYVHRAAVLPAARARRNSLTSRKVFLLERAGICTRSSRRAESFSAADEHATKKRLVVEDKIPDQVNAVAPQVGAVGVAAVLHRLDPKAAESSTSRKRPRRRGRSTRTSPRRRRRSDSEDRPWATQHTEPLGTLQTLDLGPQAVPSLCPRSTVRAQPARAAPDQLGSVSPVLAPLHLSRSSSIQASTNKHIGPSSSPPAAHQPKAPPSLQSADTRRTVSGVEGLNGGTRGGQCKNRGRGDSRRSRDSSAARPPLSPLVTGPASALDRHAQHQTSSGLRTSVPVFVAQLVLCVGFGRMGGSEAVGSMRRRMIRMGRRWSRRRRSTRRGC
ncbi:hypothetical protein B0H16DRAFT_1764990 [Mycena metata]|uniref:Uncharacterized protein n=1 Tax=Mycena metata TaxID=1033252 RepID=A0AAD7I5W4_9AGAR|nr:hypothetical protein B0H16DRAFT_1764990 [Mycena metata]